MGFGFGFRTVGFGFWNLDLSVCWVQAVSTRL
jgi:hypothetical protein